MAIKVEYGNALDVKADVIVNSANKGLIGGGGIDGAIHKLAGSELAESIKDNYKENPDGSRLPDYHPEHGVDLPNYIITPSFSLADKGFKYIIHFVIPDKFKPEMENWYKDNISVNLSAAVSGVKNLDDVNSVAIPAMGTGIFGYPKRLIGEVLKDSLRSHSEDLDIYLCANNDMEMFSAFNR